MEQHLKTLRRGCFNSVKVPCSCRGVDHDKYLRPCDRSSEAKTAVTLDKVLDLLKREYKKMYDNQTFVLYKDTT